MSKFTKGPWTCVEVEFGDYQTGEVGFVVDSKEGPEIMVGSVANCNLIAAAPDMYEALYSALGHFDSIGFTSGSYPAINIMKALNKADGQ